MKTHPLGQTLIEVLITILFIGVGVIALMRFQSYLAYDYNLTEKKAEATLIATKQMETLRDFQVLNNTSGYTSYQGIASGSANTTINNTTYAVTWTVTTFTNPDYKVIAVTVGWTDQYSNSHSIQLVSDVAGIEPANSSSIM